MDQYKYQELSIWNKTPKTVLLFRFCCLVVQEAALIFGSGFIANDAALGTLGTLFQDVTFLSDEENHGVWVGGVPTEGLQKVRQMWVFLNTCASPV